MVICDNCNYRLHLLSSYLDLIALGQLTMTDEQHYKLEEMKQLRSLIEVFVKEIAQLEIFAVTSIAAVVAFYLSHPGSDDVVKHVLRYVPLLLTACLAFKTYGFSTRIRIIDDYLIELEKEFVAKGAWVQYFRTHYDAHDTCGQMKITMERTMITSLMFLVSVFLAIWPLWTN